MVIKVYYLELKMQWMFFLVVIGVSSAAPKNPLIYYTGQYKTDKECTAVMVKAAQSVGVDGSWKKAKRIKQGNSFAIDQYSKTNNGDDISMSVQCYAIDTILK